MKICLSQIIKASKKYIVPETVEVFEDDCHRYGQLETALLQYVGKKEEEFQDVQKRERLTRIKFGLNYLHLMKDTYDSMPFQQKMIYESPSRDDMRTWIYEGLKKKNEM
jgi:hypothetical protein